MYTIDQLDKLSKSLNCITNDLAIIIKKGQKLCVANMNTFFFSVCPNLYDNVETLGDTLTKLSTVVLDVVSNDVNPMFRQINTLSNAMDILSEEIGNPACNKYDFYGIDYITFTILDEATSIVTSVNTITTKTSAISNKLNALLDSVLVPLNHILNNMPKESIQYTKKLAAEYPSLVTTLTDISDNVDVIEKKVHTIHNKVTTLENKTQGILEKAIACNKGKIVQQCEDKKYAYQLCRLLHKARSRYVECTGQNIELVEQRHNPLKSKIL